jgi:predicted small lipoprotein YifL
MATWVMVSLAAPASLAVAAITAGCGQKGPLYLPDRNGTVITRPAPATSPATTATPAPAGPANQAPAAPSQTPEKRNKDDDSTSPAPK